MPPGADFAGDGTARTLVHHCLQHALDSAAAHQPGPGLYGGVAGIGWTIAHLCPDAAQDALAEIDAALHTYASQSPWHGSFDLIGGLVGLGVYFLERLPANAARAGLSEILTRLDELAVTSEQGITWHTPAELVPPQQREQASDGYCNCGMAHGVPGVIAFLARCVVAGVDRDLSEQLLSGAVQWLLAEQLPAESGSAFPYWVAESAEPMPARTAWCYGDPGIAAALLVAAECTHRDDWMCSALQITDRIVARPEVEMELIDAPLCHGTAGLAHILNRAWNATGEDRLALAATHWFQKTLELKRRVTLLAGFPTWKTTSHGLEWVDEPGLLEGAAGIGLALLSAVRDQPPTWDRILLTCPT